MPTNKELQNEIAEISAELGLDTNTDELNNKELAALLKDLKAKKTDAETVTQADAPAPAKGKYRIAKGKSLTTLRGILGEGKEISAKDLTGGQASLDTLVQKGYVTE